MISFGILAVMAIDTVVVNSLLSVPKRGWSNTSIPHDVAGRGKLPMILFDRRLLVPRGALEKILSVDR
jgi:hypothetical protein